MFLPYKSSMNKSTLWPVQFICFILLPIAWSGCVSRNVNPKVARAHTGYVDIYDPEDRALSWEIKDVETGRSIYTEYKPKSGIVRLALLPGSHKLNINILNRVISKPAIVELQVSDGKVTPVPVRLVQQGTAQTDTKKTLLPGRYLRRTKIELQETQNFHLGADVLTPIPYCSKTQVPYVLKTQP